MSRQEALKELEGIVETLQRFKTLNAEENLKISMSTINWSNSPVEQTGLIGAAHLYLIADSGLEIRHGYNPNAKVNIATIENLGESKIKINAPPKDWYERDGKDYPYEFFTYPGNQPFEVHQYGDITTGRMRLPGTPVNSKKVDSLYTTVVGAVKKAFEGYTLVQQMLPPVLRKT